MTAAVGLVSTVHFLPSFPPSTTAHIPTNDGRRSPWESPTGAGSGQKKKKTGSRRVKFHQLSPKRGAIGLATVRIFGESLHRTSLLNKGQKTTCLLLITCKSEPKTRAELRNKINIARVFIGDPIHRHSSKENMQHRTWNFFLPNVQSISHYCCYIPRRTTPVQICSLRMNEWWWHSILPNPSSAPPCNEGNGGEEGPSSMVVITGEPLSE